MHYLNIFLLPILLFLASISHSHAQFFSKKQPDLLPEQEAFQVEANIDEQGNISALWSIADGYYMYREQFSVAAHYDGATHNEAALSALALPKGQIEDDPEFGEVEVYFFNAEIRTQLLDSPNKTDSLTLEIKGQGCNKPVGVCYPPISRIVKLDLDHLTNEPNSNTTTVKPEPSPINSVVEKKSFFAYILAAFGAGILLSFTPCVLPMIPILAGIIAGQKQPSKLRSGWLAICYVFGTIITYTIAGAIAGATGAQLQAYFQNPYVIGFICLLLIGLALSLFGVFKIELPSSLQTRLNNSGVNSRSASLTSFILGLISALVVGACVSPVLILALGAAITQGDPVLGAGIMGSMAFGMGLLLILFGFGAGWLLPKTGSWMQQIQIIFGFMVLGVAIYLLSIFDAVPTLLLWSALLFCSGFYIWQVTQNTDKPFANSVGKTLASLTIIWGGLCLIGFATGSKEVLKPLSELSLAKSSQATASLAFNKTTQLTEVQALLEQAKQKQQPVLIDFYADWCLDCKRMHRTTFRDSQVISALDDWQLIEIDVTNTSPISEEVKQFFDVFGPPAILLFDRQGNELSALRQYGYLNAEQFLSHIRPVQ